MSFLDFVSFRNNMFKLLRASFISADLHYRKGSFAHLTLRRNANRYLLSTREFVAHSDGELYILDEVYGEIT